MEGKHKVLFLIDSLTCGGAEKSLISLLPLLDYTKIDVDLMIVHRGGLFETYLPKQVNVVDFPKQNGIWFHLCLTFFRLIRLFFSKKHHGAELRWQVMSSAYVGADKIYDVGIAYQQGFPTYYLASKITAKKKITWINADLEKAGYRPSFNRPFYDKINVVVPVSDVLCEMLIRTSFVDSNKISIVYDILNVDLIRQMSKKPLSLSLIHNELIITTVGRMVLPKGYDLAVDAAKILKEKGLQFKWFFVGGGNMKPEIKRMATDYGLLNNIIFTGVKSNPYPYMALADIYVQTSRFEGFGLTISEARILNKPVISTNFPVVYNQIKDGENGLICEMSPESIAQKILLLANDEQLRNKLIEGTKKEVNLTAQTEPQKVMNLILS
jgi:glycosyltransferase involved in cell wall biosynthesis